MTTYDSDNSQQSDDIDLVILARSGLIETVENNERGEERPPEPEDYTCQRQNSLEVLNSLIFHANYGADGEELLSVLLLCSQHCSSSLPHPLPECPWSSPQHRDKADKLLAVVTGQEPVSHLLSQNDFMLFKKIMKELQPKLESFISNPVAVCSLVWCAGQLNDNGPVSAHDTDQGPVSVSAHATGQGLVSALVPQLLPHALHLTDCWLPYYKLWGCHLVDIIVRGSSDKELVFYGRAELLCDTLTRLLSHTDTGVVLACGQPLVTLTRLRHEQETLSPVDLGPGDSLVSELVTRLDMSSDSDKRRVYCDLLLATVPMLGPGVARWVSRVSEAMVQCLDTAAGLAPVAVFSVISHMVTTAPECVARDMVTLLPALLRWLYTVSLQDNVDPSLMTLATHTAQLLTTCDPALASSLCHGLNTTSVNKTFDSAVNTIVSQLPVSS